MNYELYHHGIRGQKWGERNGPPYPLGVNDHSAAERRAGYQKSIKGGSKSEREYSRSKNTNNNETATRESEHNKSFLARHKKAIIAAGVVGASFVAAHAAKRAYDDYNVKNITEVHKFFRSSEYMKKHYDKVIPEGTDLATLSWDPDRTKDTDMFFATYKTLDKHQYNALFNKPASQEQYDSDGNPIGTGMCLKYRIKNTAKRDLKIASEDSSIEVFKQLIKDDKDFKQYVMDPERMQSNFVEGKYVFKGYRDARSALDRMRKNGINDKDLGIVYRMFNYTIPSDGGDDKAKGADVAKQRAKFFKGMSNSGYDGILDTNDALYGGFKASAPVIMFNMDAVVLSDVERTTMSSHMASQLITVGRKALGV